MSTSSQGAGPLQDRPGSGGRGSADIEITVAGTARVAVPPELATLSLTVGVETRDQREALATTVELVRRLRARLEELSAAPAGGVPGGAGVAPVSWSSIQPIRTASWRYQEPGREPGQERTMHSASAPARVSFVDFDALADFVSEFGAVAGAAVNGVEWALTEATRDRLEAAVLTVAVERARTRATAIAHASGALNVRFVSIADPGLLAPEPPTGARMYARDEAMSVAGGVGSAGAPTPEDIVIETTLHARFVAS